MSGIIGFSLKEAENTSSPFLKCKLGKFILPTTKKQSIQVDICRTKAFGTQKKYKGTVVRGMYNVKKECLSKQQLHNFKIELTLSPKESSMGITKKPYVLWKETDTWFQMPRFFGISKLGLPEKSLLVDGEKMKTLPLLTAPRDYQKKPIETIVKIFKTPTAGTGVLLEADCGTGKTFLGIEIARRHGQKTAVIVNKGDLQMQFMERIKQYCPDASVGIVRRDCIDIKEKDFVIFMAQSISTGRYDKSVFESFGLVIIDEAHHFVAETLSKTLSHFPSRCVLGLTATPNRKDQLGYALPYFFGPIAVKMKRRGQQVDVKIIKVPVGKAVEIIGRNGKPILARTITMMTQDEDRNEKIVKTILSLRKKNRHIIVMGERRKHLIILQQMVMAKTDCPTGLYVGENTKKGIAKREKTKNSPILFATTKMAEEGMDIPRLDTLLLVTPKSNITQCVGRIQRSHPDKHLRPLIVDFYDLYCGGAVHGMARARKKYYDLNKFKIT